MSRVFSYVNNDDETTQNWMSTSIFLVTTIPKMYRYYFYLFYLFIYLVSAVEHLMYAYQKTTVDSAKNVK